MLAISKHLPPRKKVPAEKLIDHLTDEKAQARLFACGGYGPVLTKVYDAYEADRGTTCPPVGSSETTPVSEQDLGDLAAELAKSIDRAEPRPKSPYYAQFSEVFRRCARGVWEKKVERATFIASAPAMLESALNGRVPDERPPC